MKPSDLVNHKAPKELLSSILLDLHRDGPVNQEKLEALSYLKHFHPEVIKENEPRLMYLLGLFYKASEPSDLISIAYSIFQDSIKTDYAATLTPVQARIQKQIMGLKYFSFSAPTSTGKSYILRELILKIPNDIVIVLPSRALISEYLLAVRNIVKDNKEILVLQFVDIVNIRKTRRRIFIITPERGGELFKFKEHLDIGLFIFDEAQISEAGLRGLTFDALVRRVDKTFPAAKKAFVHPFVENPQAQLSKHGFKDNAGAQVFNQNAVGKIFIEADNGKFQLFSPFIKDFNFKKNKHIIANDIAEDVLSAKGSVLVYVSKQFIYEQRYRTEFKKYIDLCPKITNPEALSIINEVETLIGAKEQHSEMIDLMRQGVIIHHGSIPLSVRYLIEAFANKHFARICFATSTLAQGVNIPFDLVWIDNLRFFGTKENQTLGLKNLIGRAGRTSQNINNFDYGYVVVSDCESFVERFARGTEISTSSILDDPTSANDSDVTEFVSAVKNGTIDEDYSLPASKVERLRSKESQHLITNILDLLFNGDRIITGDEYRALSKDDRGAIRTSFARIFELSLNRDIEGGERSVLSTAISILLWQIQGRSFRTLIGLRHSYLSRRSEQSEINKRFREGKISEPQREQELGGLKVRFTAIATQLPSKGTRKVSRFPGVAVNEINYDVLVYDTYDYLDKVISFSLSDVYISAFNQYFLEKKDARAAAFVNFFRYGTNNPVAILLMRYGFSADNLESIIPHVKSISENEIVFAPSSSEVSDGFDSYLIEHYQ